MEVVSRDTPKETTENSVTNNSREEVPKKSKKDDKSVEQFMKSLNSITNTDEKLSAVCKKYIQMAEENKQLQFYNKQADKRNALLMKEKEHLQHEFNKTILAKSKLENLCRELQKLNKAIKEESLLKIREEEERRKETQAKFQNTLTEITALLQQNNEKNVKLRDDNISMSEKFKSVVQQYQLREQQVDKMAKQMALESQLADAKLQKASLEHQAERERLLADMEGLKVTIAQYRAKIVELQETETALKSQLAVYTDKYDEFQNALVKSNQVFGNFKEQMETMSKKLKKLEKESLSWKKRWEVSQTALLDMCGERQIREERITATTRQLHHMQSLCRTLQAERTVLLNTLKENNIERPPLPAVSPAPPPPPPPQQPTQPKPDPKNNASVDAMFANCAQLRQSLAHLQTQLNVLTNNKNEGKEEPVKVEKPKKSKSKKNKADKQSAKVDCEKIDQKETESDEPSVCKSTGDELLTADDNDNLCEGDTADRKADENIMESILQAYIPTDSNLYDLEAAKREVNSRIEAIASGELEIPVAEELALIDDNINEEIPTKVTEDISELNNCTNDEIAHIAEVKSITTEELASS